MEKCKNCGKEMVNTIHGYCSVECYNQAVAKRETSLMFKLWGLKRVKPHVNVEKKTYHFIGHDRKDAALAALAYYMSKGYKGEYVKDLDNFDTNADVLLVPIWEKPYLSHIAKLALVIGSEKVVIFYYPNEAMAMEIQRVLNV